MLAGVSVLFSGCVSMKSVPVPAPGQPQSFTVKVADKVEVKTAMGEKLAFQVTAIEPEALVGKDVRVRYRDIVSLQVERVDKGRTTIAVVGTIVVVVGLLWVAAANAYSGGYLGL
jgi:hypothetical protein